MSKPTPKLKQMFDTARQTRVRGELRTMQRQLEVLSDIAGSRLHYLQIETPDDDGKMKQRHLILRIGDIEDGAKWDVFVVAPNRKAMARLVADMAVDAMRERIS